MHIMHIYADNAPNSNGATNRLSRRGCITAWRLRDRMRGSVHLLPSASCHLPIGVRTGKHSLSNNSCPDKYCLRGFNRGEYKPGDRLIADGGIASTGENSS